MKRILHFFITIMLLGIIIACSNEGELVEEDTYIPFNLEVLGDTNLVLQAIVNNDSLNPSSQMYLPIGKDFSMEIRNKETNTTVLDTTLLQGETELQLVMYYPGDGFDPIIFEEVGEVESAPEGYIKTRFINLDKQAFAGKTIDLVLKGALLDIREVRNDTTLYKNNIEEILRIENIKPTAFSEFYELPRNTSVTSYATLFWELYDSNTKEPLYTLYFEEGRRGFIPRSVGYSDISEELYGDYVSLYWYNIGESEVAPFGLTYGLSIIYELSDEIL